MAIWRGSGNYQWWGPQRYYNNRGWVLFGVSWPWLSSSLLPFNYEETFHPCTQSIPVLEVSIWSLSSHGPNPLKLREANIPLSCLCQAYCHNWQYKRRVLLPAWICYILLPYLPFFMYLVLCTWMFSLNVRVCTSGSGALRGQERVLNPLELELKLLRAIMWVLEIKPRSFTRATSALNQSALSSLAFGFSLLCSLFFTVAMRRSSCTLLSGIGFVIIFSIRSQA